MRQTISFPQVITGFVTAAIGGGLGYVAFFWIARQGFYTLIVPPALLGFGAGLGIQRRSQPFAITCGTAGFLLALVIEWQFAPFIANKTFPYFLTHLHQCQPLTQLMFLIGTLICYRLALGMEQGSDKN
jgi:hypothetical protein